MQNINWISVNQKLPTQDGHYLVWDNKGDFGKAFYECITKDFIPLRNDISDITHWTEVTPPSDAAKGYKQYISNQIDKLEIGKSFRFDNTPGFPLEFAELRLKAKAKQLGADCRFAVQPPYVFVELFY